LCDCKFRLFAGATFAASLPKRLLTKKETTQRGRFL
jgi:hypothetical protein